MDKVRSGIVEIPRGSRGPRSLYVPRRDDSFGFKLRHLIVYPPSANEDRHARAGDRLQHMETIFVRSIVEGGPAEQAGLRVGDRLVAVNGASVTDKPYAEVVNYIQHSPDYLHLLVISKEEDIIQKYYKEFAYNPVSNQIEPQSTRKLSLHHQQVFPQHLATIPRGSELQADAISWRSLQNSNYNSLEHARLNPRHPREQRSADNILSPSPKHYLPGQRSLDVIGYRPIHPNDVQQRPRAQPQVPQRNMGRRASEGSSFAERDIYEVVNDSTDMVVGDNGAKMKTATKGSCYPDTSHHPSLEMNYQNAAGCRLSLDGGRRDSTTSLTSSLADGSKDSLSSYDSSSTITGGYDTSMMTRILRNLQQKEEFLRTNNPPGPKEFYGRPQRLEKPVWPPQDPRNESPSRTVKPTHQNFQRVKNDIDIERDYSPSRDLPIVGAVVSQQRAASVPRDIQCKGDYRMPEASIAPSIATDTPQHINGTNTESADVDEKRNSPTVLQIVQTRAKQFESGRSLPEDDPLSDRTSFYRSELARVSAKRVVPSVPVRAREFETRGGGGGVDTHKDTAVVALRKTHRDSRSLDSSDASNFDNQPNKMRHRSNSADSWVIPPVEGVKKESLGNGLDVTTKRDRTLQEAMDTYPTIAQNVGNLSPLIPEPVEQLSLVQNHAPKLCVTTVPQPIKPPVRPTQLDLVGAPKRPIRHLRPPPESAQLPPSRSFSQATEDRPIVVRRTKNTNLAEEDRAMRRESYLKATEGGRMPFDSDFSDGDISPHVLRSAHRRWRPPLFPGDIQQLRKLFEEAASSLGGSVSGGSSNSSVSLDREKRPSSPSGEREKLSVIREGSLHCKITEIDGKRSADRSWKQLWVVLRGPKLYLYKDKHHQSPVGTSDVAEQSLASGIDMRASCVGIPEDYTKRKHVLRVSSVVPCRSEILLQAENPVDLAEWVKCLQDQVAANDEEFKSDHGLARQQAVPQTIPASTSIQVQGSTRLSPPANKSKLSNLRNRSPTGHSPVPKSRKPVQIGEVATSPKSKTWRGRVAKQFRKIQGASSPTSPTAPEGSTFGVYLDQCQPSNYNQYVPRLVEVCTEIVESKGLETIGIYRVPGNNAAVTALTEEANRCYDELTQIDPRWNDVHVVSSLLKSFFRKMPDSLLTANLYPKFIEADKIDNLNARLEQIKKLTKMLPSHHYHTLKHLILHLRRVVANCDMNKMEAKNLAIVFGPTIVRAAEESMETMVNDMTHQCKIVESLLVHAEKVFSDLNIDVCAPMAVAEAQETDNININLLLHNIRKVEGFKEQKEKKEFIHSIISAAQRTMKRKQVKHHGGSQESKDEISTSNGVGEFANQSFDVTDYKQNLLECKQSNVPTTVTDLEQSAKPRFNYKTDKEQVQQRIENFIKETEANLNARKVQKYPLERRGTGPISSSASNVSQAPALSLANNPHDRVIMKTHSASNVFSRTTNSDNSRNSLSSADSYRVQYPANYVKKYGDYGSYNRNSDQYDRRRRTDNNAAFQVYKSSFSDVSTTSSAEMRNYNTSPTGYGLRKGNSAENLNVELNSDGNMKTIKYENEAEANQPKCTGSLDSLNKIDEDGDLLKTMTKIFDEKKKELTSSPLLNDIDLPFVDDSPEKVAHKDRALVTKETTIPASPKLYRDPSLHKSQYSSSKLSRSNKELKENVDKEKDEDCTMMVQDENIPDNERNISNQDKVSLSSDCKKINFNLTLAPTSVKLKRSESLNKPERTVSPLTIKLKRSESLNKSSDRLKRSDSLTKNEKTESNISKRRELVGSSRRGKEFTKLKRKNGMPERSIKRRHTVGGTKDPDKVTWLDNRNHKEDKTDESVDEKRTLRTSSPDLSTSRKERLFLQLNFEIAPEEMVAAFKQHFIGARPQSFPETSVYKVPLESHV